MKYLQKLFLIFTMCLNAGNSNYDSELDLKNGVRLEAFRMVGTAVYAVKNKCLPNKGIWQKIDDGNNCMKDIVDNNF